MGHEPSLCSYAAALAEGDFHWKQLLTRRLQVSTATLAGVGGRPYGEAMPDANARLPERSVAPHERAPERRRQELLAAATIEFATHGFAGARTQVIADRTTSNKALIYGYFGSKEGLYLAVLESLYASIRAEEQTLALDALPPGRGAATACPFHVRILFGEPALRGDH